MLLSGIYTHKMQQSLGVQGPCWPAYTLTTVHASLNFRIRKPLGDHLDANILKVMHNCIYYVIIW